MLSLGFSFFTVALFYSIVGFGGGSSYIAILAAVGTPYEMIPKVSLICNIIVVTGGAYHAINQGHFNKKLITPFVLSSAPMAFLGGLVPVSEKTFFILLTSVLILCGLRLLFIKEITLTEVRPPSVILSIVLGAVLGGISGMVGIGGGIFLSPILINLGFSRSKEAAATASFFILVNSIFSLCGHLIKSFEGINFEAYLWPFVAVFIGGQIGSRLGTGPKLSYRFVQRGTGVLTLIICVRLLLKTLS